MKFSIKDFFSKCNQSRNLDADLVTFTGEILNGKLRFLCSEIINTQEKVLKEILKFIQICNKFLGLAKIYSSER